MSQIVSYQQIAHCCSRRILSRRKYHVAAHSVGSRVYRARRLCSLGVCMYSYLAEIMAKAWLHKGTRSDIERLARGIENVMHDRRKRQIAPKAHLRWRKASRAGKGAIDTVGRRDIRTLVSIVSTPRRAATQLFCYPSVTFHPAIFSA